ncbi:ABC transporter permease subunit [Marinisporobacter balticus]|uniref:Simple sugar transport system permease protein n=1 Tax=Marinisporobacter balticus TaxID=2018667 RepID=A0A4R2KM07_9FIRM|nr:ABC transporter permease [Marinisporobacter balticus]TCO73662.1 simple sugar transport system permease protein [Marinisporobacter balticus]
MSNTNHVEVLEKTKESEAISLKMKSFFIDHSVTILFIIICLIGVKISKLPLFFITSELLTRISRNSFLVLSLIIPVLAGMGLNFGITIGAMAGQIAIIAVTHWGITGIQGFLLCGLLSVPIAMIFGYLIGTLLNKTKGQEMITSMIAGFFANGIYQFIFLFAVGSIIPMKDPIMMLSSGIGIRNTVDLSKNVGIKYALDNLKKVPAIKVLLIALVATIIIYSGIRFYKIKNSKKKEKFITGQYLSTMIGCFVGILICSIFMFHEGIPNNLKMITKIKLPIATCLVIAGLCLFNVMIVKTKLGQDFRTVGQDNHIAKISGINVNKIRIIAITLSTLLAAWGQLIFLQNIGTLNTYGSHVQIATFSIAALLIGGASVSRATIGQAILGTILFHTLFIVSPMAGKNLFGDAQIGEFFRAFVAYGVIGLSLGLHAWRKRVGVKSKLE